MGRKLYIADARKFMDFFDHREKTPYITWNGSRKIVPIKGKATFEKSHDNSMGIEILAPTQGVVERAISAQKRAKRIKAREGDKIIRTKKIRPEGKSTGKAAVEFKDTPAVDDRDIFKNKNI